MSTRRLYDKRTTLAIADLKDQPEARFVVFLPGAIFGQKAVVSCDRIEVSPSHIGFLREMTPKGAIKPDFIMVAAVPHECEWGVIEYSRLVQMSGEQWEEFQAEDNKSRVDTMEKVFGKSVIKAFITPDGKMMPYRATPEEVAEAEKAVNAQEAEPEGCGYRGGVTHI